MEFQQFKKLNNIGGWLIFAIAALVYTATMESTASLWDCGEFIASSYKLQVVHPPGAPLFLMIGRMFSLLAMGNPENVAWFLNLMSALCSAFSMMFLFWIITHLARRMLTKDGTVGLDFSQVIAILGAGAIGALAATFADSIWFSAVEAEVYSMSLLCTSIVFWAILKWEERANEPYADRWLLFIAFMIGCSIFVHWLNLLTIPAMVFVYYFKRFKPTRIGMFLAFLVSIAILGFILKIVITSFVSIAAGFELAFVNGLGLPFNSGLIFFLLLFIAALAFGLWYTYKNNRPTLHNALLGFMFIMIGYSTIATTVIRSNADPNIDMNSPEDVVSLDSYLKREQYGSRPFLTGYYYTADVVGVNELGKKYSRGEKEYDVVGRKIDYEYDGRKILFPRMWDSTPANRERYEKWVGLKKGEKPSYADNINFFLKYQIGHMYVRYFLWNFVGRQNDEQGVGDRFDGNWLSGIGFFDSMRLGPQSNLPDAVANHPARNTYYFIPLLLGLLGLVFHFTNDRKRAFVVTLLFLFCGVAIIIQGNSPPIEPRERDYIFAGSFYAFTIWIGLGVIALFDILRGMIDKKMAGILAVGICTIAPLLMASQNWDDHSRHGRYAARDFAANYLESCAPNSIIFTQGDNDTYPLWYAQEVEGIRRDVRVVNLSLLGVDWYINQLRRKVNDAAPVPMTMTPDKIRGSSRDVVAVVENTRIAPEGKYVSLQEIMKFVADDSPRSKAGGSDRDYIPTRNLKMASDPNKSVQNGAIGKGDEDLIVPEIKWQLPRNKRSLYKNDVMVLDIIAANNWERPIYFAISVSPGSYLGMEKYFQLEGLAYRLVPIENSERGPYKGRVNTEIMYSNLMNKFKFGNINDKDVHVDSDLRRMTINFRGNYARLAEALTKKGDKKRALEVLDRSLEMMPDDAAPFDMYMYGTIESYYETGNYKRANEVTEQVANRLLQDLAYYKTLGSKHARAHSTDRRMKESFITQFANLADEKGEKDFAKQLKDRLAEVKG